MSPTVVRNLLAYILNVEHRKKIVDAYNVSVHNVTIKIVLMTVMGKS